VTGRDCRLGRLCDRRAPLVQAVRTRRRWFRGFAEGICQACLQLGDPVQGRSYLGWHRHVTLAACPLCTQPLGLDRLAALTPNLKKYY